MSMTRYLTEYHEKHPDVTVIIEANHDQELTHYSIVDVLSDAVLCKRQGIFGEDDGLTLVPFHSILRISELVE